MLNLHISVPIHRLLLSGIDPMSMPCPQELLNLSKSRCFILLPQGRISSLLGSSGKLLTNGSVLLGQVITHHLYLGVVCLSSSVLGFRLRFYTSASYMQLLSWNAQLSMNLAIAGS